MESPQSSLSVTGRNNNSSGRTMGDQQKTDMSQENALEIKLCHAIKANNDATIRAIIDSKEFLEMIKRQRPRSSGFPGGNMHTVLLVETKKFEYLDLMMAKGDKLPEPHARGCICDYCQKVERPIDSLVYWNITIRVYMAILHDEYLSRELSYYYKEDPMKRLLNLYTTTKNLKHDNKLVHDGMGTLKDITTSYPTLLLDSAKSYREVALVLSQGSTEDDDKFRLVERAYGHHLKEFVTHPKCQLLIDNEWYGPLLHKRFLPESTFGRVALALITSVIAPPIYTIIAIFWTLGLTSLLRKSVRHGVSIMELVRTPVIRFYAYLSSYLIFFLIISYWVIQFGDNKGLEEARFFNDILKEDKPSMWTADCFGSIKTTQNTLNDSHTHDSNVRQLNCRNDDLSILMVLQAVWIGAILFREIAEIITKPLVYIKNTGNYVDFISAAFYTVTLATYFHQLAKTRQAREWFELTTDSATHVNIGGNVKPAFEGVLRDELQDRSKHIYWLNSNRLFWFWFDPVFIGQVLHGAGTAALFVRFLSISLEFGGVGTLYTALYRMGEKTISFVVLQVILIIVFGVSMRTIGYGYTTVAFNENWGSYLSALNALFWSIFTQTEGTLAAYFTKDKLSLTAAPQREMARATTTFGTFVLGVYYMLMTVFILNMLIAFLTSLYQDEQKGKDREWRWLKVRQRLEFLQSGKQSLFDATMLPPPLNVLTSLRKWLTTALRWCLCCKQKPRAVKSYTSYERLVRRSQMRQEDYIWPEGGILSSVYDWEEDHWNLKKKEKDDRGGKLVVQFLRHTYGLETAKPAKVEDTVATTEKSRTIPRAKAVPAPIKSRVP